MSGFTLCSLVQSLENATLPVVGTALTELTLEALTTSACGTFETCQPALKLSAYRARTEVSRTRSERRD
jgi:hypothetical protein